MERDFMFNLPMKKFGYLTGRSPTTVKRDFKKAFSTTPQRWPTHQQLERAHYQVTEKEQKPLDVCYEVGFESLSHLSFAFKKPFKIAPSHLTNS